MIIYNKLRKDIAIILGMVVEGKLKTKIYETEANFNHIYAYRNSIQPYNGSGLMIFDGYIKMKYIGIEINGFG